MGVHHARLLVCAALFGAGGFGQMRVSVNLVEVDAVVTDGKGRQVTDLTAGDFELFQDGKRQPIKHCAYVSTAPVASAAPVPPGAPLAGARGTAAMSRRTIAIVVDDLGLSAESMSHVNDGLRTFVDERMQPGDRVAILRTGGGMDALGQFTSDKNLLHAAIARLKYKPLGHGKGGAFSPVDAAEEGRLGEEIEHYRESHSAQGTVAAVRSMITGLKQIEGRKAMVLITDGIQDPDSDLSRKYNDPNSNGTRELAEAANRASVVIYAVSARGPVVLLPGAAERPMRVRGPAMAGIMNANEEGHQRSLDGLRFLTRETGGLLEYNNNDIAAGVGKMLDDQNGYYLIGYTPDELTFRVLKDQRRNFHQISVKVKARGVTVRARAGFLGVPDAGKEPSPQTPDQQLAAAMRSPFAGGAMRLSLSALFARNLAEGSVVQSTLVIDGRDVQFSNEPDGWRQAVIDVQAANFGAGGVPVDQIRKTYTVRFPEEQYRAAIEHGFPYTMTYPVKKAGGYLLRVAVRDGASGRVGSASQFIEVPDLSNGRLAISGIMMQSKQDADLLGSAAMRVFHAGTDLDYVIQVLNPAQTGTTGQPDLELQLSLFHDGRQIFAGKPRPLGGELSSDRKSVLASGQVHLGSSLEAGDYTIRIVVTDKATKAKTGMVAQTGAFEVVR
jgi:VWFA-related protein